MNTSFADSVNTNKNHIKTIVYPLFIFMCGSIIAGLIFLFLQKSNNYDFIVNGEPSFAIPSRVHIWISFCMIVLLGVCPFMLYYIRNSNPDKMGQKLNYSLFYCHLLFVLVWALCSFTLSSPILGVIGLTIAIAIGIFATYRFMSNTITAGVILFVWNVWLIFMFVLNLAYCLLI